MTDANLSQTVITHVINNEMFLDTSRSDSIELVRHC